MTSTFDVRALVIDLDGTMADTMGDFVAVLDRCLQDMGLDALPESQVRQLVGKGSEHLIRSVLALRVPHWNELPPEAQAAHFDQAWALYQTHYAAMNGQHTHLFPGVQEGLVALQKLGLPMACLTNKPTAFARPLLTHLGLDGFFQLVYGGDAFPQKKPHPLSLQKTCEALGLPPSQVLMVGDSSNDALAAQAAGCRIALVRYGYNHGQPIEQSPHDWLLDSLLELPACIRP